MYHKKGWYPVDRLKERMVFNMAVCAENVADKPCSFQQCKRCSSPQTISPPCRYIAVHFFQHRTSAKTAYKAQIVPHKKRHYLTYDAEKNELQYNGRVVRWFEDYYTVGDNMRAGRDFFNENGVVDIYAVRDFSNIVRAEDGSFDPGGTPVWEVPPFDAAIAEPPTRHPPSSIPPKVNTIFVFIKPPF